MADTGRTYLGNIPITDFEPTSTTGVVMFNQGEGNDGFLIANSLQFVSQSDLSDVIKYNSDNNIELREKAKILGKNENDNEYEILGLNEYEISGQIYDQVEVGTTHIHLNLNTNYDPIFDNHITVDTNEQDGSNVKKLIAYTSEGVLNLASKYFTPVDNGSGGLQLSGITFQEIQQEYNRYQSGLISIQTNTNGFINLTVDNFTINDDVISFQYRWALADYVNGIINVYQALISATTGGIITPVNLLYSYQLQSNM